MKFIGNPSKNAFIRPRLAKMYSRRKMQKANKVFFFFFFFFFFFLAWNKHDQV